MRELPAPGRQLCLHLHLHLHLRLRQGWRPLRALALVATMVTLAAATEPIALAAAATGAPAAASTGAPAAAATGAPAADATAAPAGDATPAESHPPGLHCRVETSGVVTGYDFALVEDPYAVKPMLVNEHFLFEAAVVGSGRHVEYVALYTWFRASRQPDLLQEVRYERPLLPADGTGGSLTGDQLLYAPGLGREFRYECRLVESAP